jgi:uncharacterized protein YecA (UPF0149 family)
MNTRNKPCYCGSKKKYKKCHYLIECSEKEKKLKEKQDELADRMQKLVLGA